MGTAAVDKLIWVLVYGGLLLACLGLFVLGQGPVLGGVLVGTGVLATVAGAVLVWVRSRMKN